MTSKGFSLSFSLLLHLQNQNDANKTQVSSHWLPRWLTGTESACQCRRSRRPGFDPWVGEIPWRRKLQPAPVFLPGIFHGQRSLVGYSPWGLEVSDMIECACTQTTLVLCSGPSTTSFFTQGKAEVLTRPTNLFMIGYVSFILFTNSTFIVSYSAATLASVFLKCIGHTPSPLVLSFACNPPSPDTHMSCPLLAFNSLFNCY